MAAILTLHRRQKARRSQGPGIEGLALSAAHLAGRYYGYIGYMEPYATSHGALDKDEAFQEEVRNIARALGHAVTLHRAGKYQAPDKGLVDPRPK
jgi:hypothetical protein